MPCNHNTRILTGLYHISHDDTHPPEIPIACYNQQSLSFHTSIPQNKSLTSPPKLQRKMPLFTDTSEHPERFFDILPEDWREGIEPYWPEYAETATIYILENETEVLGGGIIFSTVSPDAKIYAEKAQQMFDQGYLYLAYIWIAPTQRGKNLGSEWLKQVQKQYPVQPFWLTIEEYELHTFYEKNGFQLLERLDLSPWGEWAMVK